MDFFMDRLLFSFGKLVDFYTDGKIQERQEAGSKGNF